MSGQMPSEEHTDTLLFTFILTHPSFVYPEFHSVLSLTKSLQHCTTAVEQWHASTIASSLDSNESDSSTHPENTAGIVDTAVTDSSTPNAGGVVIPTPISKPRTAIWGINKPLDHYDDIIYCQADLSNFPTHAFLHFPSSKLLEVESDVQDYFLKRCVLLDHVHLFYKQFEDFQRDCIHRLKNPETGLLFKSYKIDIVTTNRRLTLDEVKAYREKYVGWVTRVAENFYGEEAKDKYPTVSLKEPEVVFSVLIDFERLGRVPIGEYFGRNLGESSRRSLMGRYALNKRNYIGTTSMTPLLSFLSANQALIGDGSLVLDPFVGTGSLLIASAHLGSYVMGTDLDIRVLKGNDGKNLHSNFQQYGLDNKVMFDVFRTCLSQQSIWKCSEIFDAIITDPPYGKRESASKIGRDKPLRHGIIGDDHIPSRVQYDKQELIQDFLNLAARLIKVGGRLVYWLISDILFRVEEDLPTHPCFKLVCISENRLSKKNSRRLVTMEKVISYEEGVNILNRKELPRREPSPDTSAPGSKKQKLNDDYAQ